MKITSEQLEKLAEWWAVKTFDIGMNQNNGDTSGSGSMSFMLMNLASMQAKETAKPNARQLFKDKLIEELSKLNDGFTIGVDYNPDNELYQACLHSGIGTYALPCKTYTEYYNGVLKGKYQYGGQWVEIV